MSEVKCVVMYGEKKALRYFLLQLSIHVLLSTIVIKMLMHPLIMPGRYLIIFPIKIIFENIIKLV